MSDGASGGESPPEGHEIEAGEVGAGGGERRPGEIVGDTGEIPVCDLCGSPMRESHCKLICDRCGYTRDCSDP